MKQKVEAKQKMQRTLIVGFDSAWSGKNRGAIVGVIYRDETPSLLGTPQSAYFSEAEELITAWQKREKPSKTLIYIDQPTIVTNDSGRRQVESGIAPMVGRRRGGVQPANTSSPLFCNTAPIWGFLSKFGGAANPSKTYIDGINVFETYPTLTLICKGWTLPETGSLPKYNPARKKTFQQGHWMYVCQKAAGFFREKNISDLADWLTEMAEIEDVKKVHQDCLDACLCLIPGLEKKNLMVGKIDTGYMMVPVPDSRTLMEFEHQDMRIVDVHRGVTCHLQS